MSVERNGRRDAPEAAQLHPHSARVSRLTETSQQRQPSIDEVGLTTYTGALVSHPRLFSIRVSPTFPSSVNVQNGDSSVAG